LKSDGIVCYFGATKATATYCWSSGVLVCIVPPFNSPTSILNSSSSFPSSFNTRADAHEPHSVPIFVGPPSTPLEASNQNLQIKFTYKGLQFFFPFSKKKKKKKLNSF